MNHILLFGKAFVGLVAKGDKSRAIRRQRDGLPGVGDRLELYQTSERAGWQLIRDDVVVTAVRPIRIFNAVTDWTTVELSGRQLILAQIRILALADGFPSTMDFIRYFKAKGLPYEGMLIEWAPDGAAPNPRRSTLCPLIGCRNDCNFCPHIHERLPCRT